MTSGARPELDPAALDRRRAAMDAALPDASISGYAPFNGALTLPDPDDRHVLAVAVRAKAQIIVTFNERDFTADTLAGFDVVAQHPQRFPAPPGGSAASPGACTHRADAAALAPAAQHARSLHRRTGARWPSGHCRGAAGAVRSRVSHKAYP
jgi:hypothetical protein